MEQLTERYRIKGDELIGKIKEDPDDARLIQNVADLTAKLEVVSDEEKAKLELSLIDQGPKYYEGYDFIMKNSLAFIHCRMNEEEILRIHEIARKQQIPGIHDYNACLMFLMNFTKDKKYDYFRSGKKQDYSTN